MTEQSAFAILESISEAVIAIDRDWRYTYVNPAAERLTGHPREELLGQPCRETFAASFGTEFESACRRAMSEGVTVPFEDHSARFDRWFEGTVSPSEGGIAVHARDITERKRAEVALKQEFGERERVNREWVDLENELAADLQAMSRLNELSRRFFASDGPESVLQELLDATIHLQHADFGNIQLYDPRAKTLEIVAQHGFQQEFLDYFRGVEGDNTACGRAFQQCERIVIEDVEADAGFEPHRRIAASAGVRAVQSTPLFTLGGDPLGVLSTHFRRPHRPSERELRLTDLFARQAAQIVERQRVEAALRRSEAYLAMGQRLSHIGTGSWNVLTGEVFWSDETYRIYGFDPGSVKPSGELFFQAAVHPEDRLFLEGFFAEVVRCGSKYDVNFRVAHADGMIRYIHSAGEPVFREDGVLVEIIGTVVDITEQKLAADASHKAHAELAQIARATALGELAASIAHEANQPIAAIVSNGDACLSWINRPEPDWIEAQAAVQRMISEGLRASEVIKSVRSLMKRAPLRMLELGINEIIGEVLILVQHEVVSHSISVHTDLADNLPCVTGDRIHLQQVFVNLLMNAIEAMTACGEGPRTILISTQLQSPDQIAVVIRDSGAGIVTENIEQMFEPFFSKKADGMGMGLWISRSIVEAHGGSLWATPNEDSGATFHFTLPANRQTSVLPYGRASDAGV